MLRLEPGTLIDLLQLRAAECPENSAYVFLANGEVEIENLTFAALDRRVRALAARLQTRTAPGDRALLLCPPGPDFITAFFACLYAGVIAVPVPPPRSKRAQPRLAAIVADARPRVVVTAEEEDRTLESLLTDLPGLAGVARYTTAREAGPLTWDRPAIEERTVAFLQYTSGSTATPKGVMVSHGNLLHNEEMIRRAFDQSSESVVVSWLPPHHDMGLIGGILQPLFLGARCVLMAPMAFLQRPRRWLEAISRYGGTTSGGPNFAYELCVERIPPDALDGLDLSTWRVAFNGSEPVRARTMERFARHFASCGFRHRAFYPCYGLAEATLFVTGGAVEATPSCRTFDGRALDREGLARPAAGDGRELVGNGRSWLGQEVVIADPESRRRLADGQTGEIWLTGPSMAEGYWRRPEESAASLRAHLAGEEDAGRFVRTGDLGFVDGGELFISGRLKDLIVLRGRNHHPEDLEQESRESHAALRSLSAAAFAVDMEGAERLILLQEVPRRWREEEQEAAITAILRALSETFEVRADAVILVRPHSLPKTSSGKVQRRLCRKAFLAGELATMARRKRRRRAVRPVLRAAGEGWTRSRLAALAPPLRRAALESELAERLAKVLELPTPRLDPEVPITGLGLDSVAMARLRSGFEEDFAIDIPLVDLLAGPTPGALVEFLIDRLEAPARTALVPPPRPAVVPLSPDQRRLWWLAQLAPDNPFYNLAGVVVLRGEVERAPLSAALGSILRRHEVLRTRFPQHQGAPRQEVVAALSLELPVIDLTSIRRASRRRREATRRARALARLPFAVDRAPLLRFALLRLRPAEHHLLIVLHHMVADGRSLEILLGELTESYDAAVRGRRALLPALPLQYADYSLLQETRRTEARREALLSARKRQLEGFSFAPRLPTDRPRPAVQDFRGRVVEQPLSPTLVAELEQLSRRLGTTLSTTLLALWQTSLVHISGEQEQVIGMPADGRRDPEAEPLIGFFVATLVLAQRVERTLSFDQLAPRTRDTVLAAHLHHEVPLERLVAALEPERDLSRQALFQVLFTLQQAPAERAAGALVLAAEEIEQGSSHFDLSLHLIRRDVLTAHWRFSSALFDATTVARWARRFTTLAATVVAAPERPLDQLGGPGPAERAQLLVEWNEAAARPVPGDLSLNDLFAAAVERHGDAWAVVTEDGRLRYRELDRRAQLLARELQRRGIGREDRVAICCDRSLAGIVALWACFRCGAAYVPLDPTFPEERLLFMLEDSGAGALLVEDPWPRRFPRLCLRAPAVIRLEEVPADAETSPDGLTGELPPAPGAENLAYLIYTSGTTGRPKGVAVEHRQLVNYLAGLGRTLGVEGPVHSATVSTLAADLGNTSVFLALTSGGCLHVLGRDRITDPDAFAEVFERRSIDLLKIVPSHLEALLADGAERRLLPRRWLILGGEAASRGLLRRLHREAAPAEVFNHYGPTEATIGVATQRFEGAERLPLGRPLDGTALYLLGASGRPVPLGSPGEIQIAGAGLARGYLGRPRQTAERFLPDPFARRPGMRRYRTGDLARHLAGGEIEFLGRVDDQLKVRGHRIEPGEIGAVLCDRPEVSEAFVAVQPMAEGEPRLVAYVVPHGGAAPTADVLRQAAARRLPAPMVPRDVVVLPSLPRTANGKIDREALPIPSLERQAAAAGTPTEELLVQIWSDLLGGSVGVDDDFFALGGHSLLATRMVARVRSVLGAELTLRDFFAAPTVAALARRLEAAPSSPVVAPAEASRGEPAPLSFSQERVWFLEQLGGPGAAYLLPYYAEVRGPLEIPVLVAALSEIVRRHRELRAYFPSREGRPIRRVASGLRIRPAVCDLGGLPEARRFAVARDLARREGMRPFDLGRGPLVRAVFLRLGPRRHHLLLTLHHMVSDAWSRRVLMDELAALYTAFQAGRPSPLPALELQFTDYAAWQRDQLASTAAEERITFWRRHLGEDVAALDLPFDRPRPAQQTTAGAAVLTHLPADLARRVHAFARQQGATLFMTSLAAFQLLLGRLGGGRRIRVGTPVANRQQEAFDPLIGFFVNTLVFTADLEEQQDFEALVAAARAEQLTTWGYQDLPFERLVEALLPERDLSRSPLFQVMFTVQNAAASSLCCGEVEFRALDFHNGTAKFDLTLYLEETTDLEETTHLKEGGGLRALLEYNTDLFDGTTAERLLRQYRTLLAAALAEPEVPIHDLPLLSASERHQLEVEWNDTATSYPSPFTLVELIARQVAKTPDLPAVIAEEKTLTYRQLDRQAQMLAALLERRGVGPESRVGVLMERSPEMVVALWAILRAGAIYVPLDPSYPAQRVAFMLEDARVSVLLAQRTALDRVPEALRSTVEVLFPDRLLEDQHPGAAAPVVAVHPDHGAYMIYTSGSTGRPKGVINTHRSIVNRLLWMQATYRLGTEDRVLQKTPFSFDVSVWEFFWPLLRGAALVLARPGGHQDAAYLVDLIERRGITTLHFVPSMFQVWLEQVEARECPTLRWVICSGEALPASLTRRFLERFHGRDVRLQNLYGPTEAAVDVTFWDCAAGAVRHSVPIGRPVANTQVHVLDRGNTPTPLGVPGELHLGGVQLARGYHRRPALTAATFVPDAIGGRPGARLYRTGDLGRTRGGGEIEFLSRLDGQVKIRGLRIELGEIEATLATHPAVREAVVLAREAKVGGLRLVAWVVPREAPLPAADLAAFLAERLPPHEVPAAWVGLEKLPLLPNGKLDRRGLPEPEDAASEAWKAPRSPLEEMLVDVWQEVLERSPVGIEEDFFALGGHSLLATRVSARIGALLGVELPVRTLFEAPTVAALAARIEDRTAATRDAEPALRRQGLRRGIPLSAGQERLWFLTRLMPSSILYNIPAVLALEGSLDVAALTHALGRLAARHEILRTRLVEAAEGPEQVVTAADAPPLPMLDLGALPPAAAETLAERLARAAAARPFDLSAGPLWRVVLLRLGTANHRLVLILHHAISDGWSSGVLQRDLATLYRAAVDGGAADLPSLPIQYADYALWQRRWLEGEACSRQRDAWRRRLTPSPPGLDLPTDRPRAAVRAGARGGLLTRALPAELRPALHRLARRRQSTLFMVLLAGFQALLHRITGQRDLTVGTPIANRNRLETEHLIGFFANTLVLRAGLEESMAFNAFLEQVRATTLEAFQHQDFPFERLVAELDVARDLSRNPLFQVFLTLHNVPDRRVELPDLALRELPVHNGSAKFDLSLAFIDRDGTLETLLEYDADLFDRTTATRLLLRLDALLAGAVEDPTRALGELPLTAAAERHQLLVEWAAGPPAPPATVSLPTLFRRQVAACPEAPALLFAGESLSYEALDRQSNQLAHALRAAGVRRGDRVGLFLERSPWLAIAVLGVFKAGAAYVPLDPAYPRQRLGWMLEDSAAVLVVTESPVPADLPPGVPAVLSLDADALAARSPTPPTFVPTAEDLAYVLFTSGSTGRPKGVQISHGALVNFLRAMARRPGLAAGDRLLGVTSLSFDIAGLELYLPWTMGATVELADRRLAGDGHALAARLESGEVTVMQATPATWSLLVEAGGWRGRGVAALCGGEALPRRLAAELQRRDCRLWNLYGPTETTIWSSVERVGAADPVAGASSQGTAVALGRPITNTDIYLLDPRLRPVAPGSAGGLFIGGEGLARGYVGRPRQTARVFLPDPLSGRSGSRMYATGDLARHLADGRLIYLGRGDHQVKLRGHRIELGEIEALLNDHPEVRESVALVAGATEQTARLVAFLRTEAAPGHDALRHFLRDRLPEYMLPSEFLMLDQWPLTPNGKIDRLALLRRARESRESGAVARGAAAHGAVAPSTALERRLAALWSEILDRGEIGIHDNFFDLGGHSLLLLRLHRKVEELAGRPVQLTELFHHPTVYTLSRYLAAGEAKPAATFEHSTARAEKKRQAQRRKKARSRARGRLS